MVLHDVRTLLQIFHTFCISFIFSKIGALVGGGGPFKCAGATNSVSSLNCRSACFRRITCRARRRAMEKFSRFKGFFPRRRSKQFFCNSVIVGSRGCRRHVRHLAAPHLIADVAIAVVAVPSAGTNSCEAMSSLGKSTGPVHRRRSASSQGIVSL